MRANSIRTRFADFSFNPRLFRCIRGYTTLTEPLVAIAIIAMLGMLALGGIRKAMEITRRTQEIHAARTLILAFHRYAQDHNGEFFNGNNNKEDAWNLNGTKLGHMPPVATRYPWRLLPYVEGGLEGSILVNQSIDEAKNQVGEYDDYSVSLLPSLAMNVTYVGSEREILNRKGEVLGYNPHTVNRLEQVHNANNLVVFVSGGAYDSEPNTSNSQPKKFHGYWYARAPYDTMSGSSWPEQPDPDFPLLGNVHFRWDGRAIVATMSGSITLMTPEELRDMRLWANPAAQANDPNWAPVWGTTY